MRSEPYARIGISNFSITFAHEYVKHTMSQKVLLNKKEVNIILHRLACQLIEKHNDFSNTILVGLQPRGKYLVDRLTQL